MGPRRTMNVNDKKYAKVKATIAMGPCSSARAGLQCLLLHTIESVACAVPRRVPSGTVICCTSMANKAVDSIDSAAKQAGGIQHCELPMSAELDWRQRGRTQIQWPMLHQHTDPSITANMRCANSVVAIRIASALWVDDAAEP